MKKALIIFLVFLTIVTVCIPIFLSHRIGLQTVFFSFGTALQSKSTFSIQNFNTDNVYILQTDTKENQLSLYRRQKDGNLMRYTIQNTNLQTDENENHQWKVRSKAELPTSPYNILSDCKALWKGKETDLPAVKAYMDLLVSAFSSTDKNSEILFDYDAFPVVISELKQLLRNDKTIQASGLRVEKSKNGIQFSFYPFADHLINQKLAEVLSAAFHPEFRHELAKAILDYSDTICRYHTTITTSIFGQFLNMKIYDESRCIFMIQKIK